MLEDQDVKVVANEAKLAELILYVAQRLRDDPKGGATKINKVLFAAEFVHMRLHGTPITGVDYQKLERGPAPRRLVPVRDQLIDSGDAILQRERYLGYPLRRLVPLREPNLDLFSEEELKSVEQALDALGPATAAEASELSHQEIGWRMVDYGDTIPYEAAFLAPSVAVNDGMRRHAQELAKRLNR